MKPVERFLLVCALALCLTVAASAADFDGYLVEIDTPACLLDASAPELPEMSEVYAPLGLYQAGDAATVERLRECGLLLHAEPNYIVTLDDTPGMEALSNLSGKARLWGASESAEQAWYEPELGMDIVRQKGVTGEGVRVGIVDSGIFKEHQAFAGVKVLDGANYCVSEDDEARHDVSDGVGHGTFVSGLIAAAGNGIGVAGLAPGVELVPLKCFESKSGSIADIAKAICDGVDTWKCQVLNLSLGIEKDSETLRKAIAYAGERGVLMVAAAGNLLSGQHNPDGDPLNYPAAYPQVIGVGAVGKTLSVAAFSYRNESVEIVAPGQSMRAPSSRDGESYVSGYGTSYAAPIVAAAAALTLSIRPDLTSAEFRELLTGTARDLGDEGYDTSYGHGLLMIASLCAAAVPEMFPEPETPPEPQSVRERVIAERQRLAALEGGAPALFAVAYNEKGQPLRLFDISPASQQDGEPDNMPILSEADISEEMFQVENAALWKLISFDRLTFIPFEAPVILPVS